LGEVAISGIVSKPLHCLIAKFVRIRTPTLAKSMIFLGYRFALACFVRCEAYRKTDILKIL
jgi:hypothetical protein